MDYEKLEAYKALYWDEFRRTAGRDQFKDLFHSYHNENAIFYTIVATPFVYLFAGGGFEHAVMWVIGIWVWCLIYCLLWDFCLNNDPDILNQRDFAFAAWLKRTKGIII